MNKRFALTLYFTVWAALSAGVVFGLTQAGYSLRAAAVFACLLFLFLNSSLAYRARVRRLQLEGKEAPPYLQYLLLPNGIPKFKENAPRPMHMLVGLAAALAGALLVICSVAIASDVKWSRIPQPVVAATICLVLAGVGAAFLYLAWRLYAYMRLPDDAA